MWVLHNIATPAGWNSKYCCHQQKKKKKDKKKRKDPGLHKGNTGSQTLDKGLLPKTKGLTSMH